MLTKFWKCARIWNFMLKLWKKKKKRGHWLRQKRVSIYRQMISGDIWECPSPSSRIPKSPKKPQLKDRNYIYTYTMSTWSNENPLGSLNHVVYVRIPYVLGGLLWEKTVLVQDNRSRDNTFEKFKKISWERSRAAPLFKTTDWMFHTGRVCHVWCSF